MKKEKSLELLRKFKNDSPLSSHEITSNYHKIDDKIIATNGVAIIALPLFEEAEYVTSYEENIRKVYPVKKNKRLSFPTSLLEKRLLKNFTKVQKTETEEEELSCEECDGDGVVEWSYSGHCKKDDCPVCDGWGYTTEEHTKIIPGETEYKENELFKIGNAVFSPLLIEKYLLETAKIIREKQITLIHQAKEIRGNLFKVGEAEVLLMPKMSESPNIKAEINV